MKKQIIIGLILLLIGFYFAPKVVLADSNFERLATEKTIDSDYLKSASNLQIDGTINGDAFLAGGIVNVNGVINGDLFVVGGKININGKVSGSVRVVGGDVSLNSDVGRNVVVASANTNLGPSSSVEGSLLVAGANLEIYTKSIGRGFRFFGNRLYLNSTINKEAFVVADKEFILGPKASISGVLKYSGSNEAILENGATVAGAIAYEKKTTSETFPRFFGVTKYTDVAKSLRPLTDVISFFVTALIGFVLLGLFSKGFEKTIRAIEIRPYASFGWGVILVMLIPFSVVLFAVTIVGIPVSLVLLIIFPVLLFVSQLIAAFFVGRKILIKRFGERRGWALVLGLILLNLVGYLPILGVLIKAVLYVFALGSIVVSYRQSEIFIPAPLESYGSQEKTSRKKSVRRR